MLINAIAGRLPGATRLDTHVVICGFPRSGSTLLQLIVESCYPTAQTYHHEKAGLNAAREILRKSPLLITKQPSDLFNIPDIRTFYDGLVGRVKFVLTSRDPRDVLTSRYSGRASGNTTRGPSGFVMSTGVWRQWHAHFEYNRRAADTKVIEYASLIQEPSTVQQQFAEFVGWAPTLPFERFLDAVPKDFETKALNGVRPFDVGNLNRWRAPKYRERIREILVEMPELPGILIAMGYESDDRWVTDYR